MSAAPYHGAESDQSNKSMGRQQAQADDDAVLQRLEVVLVHAGVDDKDEDGRDLSRSGQRVLDRRILGQQLGGQVGSGDVLVVGGKAVALEAEGADPQLATHINLAVGL
jgi:hypothetical protein